MADFQLEKHQDTDSKKEVQGDSAPADDADHTGPVCGGRARCFCAAAACVIAAAAAAAIAVGILYWRSLDWKLTTEFAGENALGGILMLSRDGGIVATGDNTREETGGVGVFETGKSGKQLGETVLFLDRGDPTLPRSGRYLDGFEPWYEMDRDLSLSGDGRTLVLSSTTALFEWNSDYEDNGMRGVCSQSQPFSDCSFGRVTVYRYENSGDWVNRDGPLYEYLEPFENLGQNLRVALSADGSTLAVCQSRSDEYVAGTDSYATGAIVFVFGLDDEGNYGRPIAVPVEIDGGTNAAAAISISGDGTRFAVGGFGEAKIYDRVAGTGGEEEWEQANNPPAGVDGYATVSAVLSGSGKRIAVSTADFTNYGSDGYLSVYEEDDDGQWFRVGNPLSDRIYSDSAAGEGLILSGDGTTMAIRQDESKMVRVFRFDTRIGDWVQHGSDIEGEVYGNALSYDGNRVATGPSGDNFVSVYDFRRGF